MYALRLLLMVGLVVTMPNVAIAQARVEKNVVVGMYSGLALIMDVHYPDEPNGYGIVHIAGSGWQRPLAYSAPLLSESQMELYGNPLVEQGYTIFSLNHRATPRFQYPAQLEDVQRAVRFIRFYADDYGIDPDRIGAIGSSSGGHLAGMLGVLDGHGNPDDIDPVNRVSAKVQAVVARSAPMDLVHMRTLRGTGLVSLLLGAVSSRDIQLEEGRRYWDASPINFVSSDDAPMLFIHGDADQIVPFEQSETMRDALNAAGVEVYLLRLPGAYHGPSVSEAQNPPDYINTVIDWFDQRLKE